MMSGLSDVRAATLAGLLALASPLSAQSQAPAAPLPDQAPDQASAETLDYLTDRSERMTIPVSIGGRGPYDFIVDTGSERTVVSQELARELGLGPGRTTTVHSMTETSRVSTVLIPSLEVGARRLSDIHAPALSRQHLGAVGMLGVDSLQSHRVDFDFVRAQMTISPSRRPEEQFEGNTIVIRGRSLLGRLVLADASVDGERVRVVIDTGAQVTIGNSALRRRLERRGRLMATFPVSLLSVTGAYFTADAGVARHIQIGGMHITNMPIAFTDAHPFRRLGLDDRPALLLGMDALRLFDRVSVDFANRRVRFQLPESSHLNAPVRMAGAEIPRRIAP